MTKYTGHADRFVAYLREKLMRTIQHFGLDEIRIQSDICDLSTDMTSFMRRKFPSLGVFFINIRCPLLDHTHNKHYSTEQQYHLYKEMCQKNKFVECIVRIITKDIPKNPETSVEPIQGGNYCIYKKRIVVGRHSYSLRMSKWNILVNSTDTNFYIIASSRESANNIIKKEVVAGPVSLSLDIVYLDHEGCFNCHKLNQRTLRCMWDNVPRTSLQISCDNHSGQYWLPRVKPVISQIVLVRKDKVFFRFCENCQIVRAYDEAFCRVCKTKTRDKKMILSDFPYYQSYYVGQDV